MTKGSARTTEATTAGEHQGDTRRDDAAELEYVPQSELGRLAIAARREYLAGGGRLLNRDEIQREVAERRGGARQLDDR